jgi:response regulator RpfG family c-di-GMP phosphodiesterase
LSQHILVIARDETALGTQLYTTILGNAGYRISRAESLGRAIALALSGKPDLVIVEQTHAQRECSAFINCLHETRPEIHVLCLQNGETRPDVLLKICRSILAAQPGGRTVHSLQEFIGKSA